MAFSACCSSLLLISFADDRWQAVKGGYARGKTYPPFSLPNLTASVMSRS
jgi:hypothetical protein